MYYSPLRWVWLFAHSAYARFLCYYAPIMLDAFALPCYYSQKYPHNYRKPKLHCLMWGRGCMCSQSSVVLGPLLFKTKSSVALVTLSLLTNNNQTNKLAFHAIIRVKSKVIQKIQCHIIPSTTGNLTGTHIAHMHAFPHRLMASCWNTMYVLWFLMMAVPASGLGGNR